MKSLVKRMLLNYTFCIMKYSHFIVSFVLMLFAVSAYSNNDEVEIPLVNPNFSDEYDIHHPTINGWDDYFGAEIRPFICKKDERFNSGYSVYKEHVISCSLTQKVTVAKAGMYYFECNIINDNPNNNGGVFVVCDSYNDSIVPKLGFEFSNSRTEIFSSELTKARACYVKLTEGEETLQVGVKTEKNVTFGDCRLYYEDKIFSEFEEVSINNPLFDESLDDISGWNCTFSDSLTTCVVEKDELITEGNVAKVRVDGDKDPLGSVLQKKLVSKPALYRFTCQLHLLQENYRRKGYVEDGYFSRGGYKSGVRVVLNIGDRRCFKEVYSKDVIDVEVYCYKDNIIEEYLNMGVKMVAGYGNTTVSIGNCHLYKAVEITADVDEIPAEETEAKDQTYELINLSGIHEASKSKGKIYIQNAKKVMLR